MVVVNLNEARVDREPKYQKLCGRNLLESDALALAAPWKTIGADW